MKHFNEEQQKLQVTNHIKGCRRTVNDGEQRPNNPLNTEDTRKIAIMKRYIKVVFDKITLIS